MNKFSKDHLALPENIRKSNEQCGVIDKLEQAKEHPSDALCESTQVVQKLGSNGLGVLSKDRGEYEGGQACDAKDKAILLEKRKRNFQSCVEMIKTSLVSFY